MEAASASHTGWWFASTAIPLLAATLGPLANVLSITAIVTPWRSCLVSDMRQGIAPEMCVWNGDDAVLASPLDGHSFRDPDWCYGLNIISLVAGFLGNFSLLCNFARCARYTIALPVTIISWALAAALLVGIATAMEIYATPVRPQQTYTQGFWYAVFAAGLYLICSTLLMANMLGHFLGHYPRTLILTYSQRAFIFQTMLFFAWLAGGGGVFSVLESKYGNRDFHWTFANAMYFCDVTILTVGFGDLYPTSNVGRGLIFPYAVGGIVILGMVVSSLAGFAIGLGSEHILQKHIKQRLNKTLLRTASTSAQYLQPQRQYPSGGLNPINHHAIGSSLGSAGRGYIPDSGQANRFIRKATRALNGLGTGGTRPNVPPVQNDRSRFELMRSIQQETAYFKRWSAIGASTTSFLFLWCVGAVVFWRCERHLQGLTYYHALYFCYASLLTVGYGDMAPVSNAGRAFFVVWSLLAVPTMAFLVNHLGDIAVGKAQRRISAIADLALLPKRDAHSMHLGRHPMLLKRDCQRKDYRVPQRPERVCCPSDPDQARQSRTRLPELSATQILTNHYLAHQLAEAIRNIAKDAKFRSNKQYSYEEWAFFSQLINFTAYTDHNASAGDDESLVSWDWVGDDSPLTAHESEADYILDRLCESLTRYIHNVSGPQCVLGPQEANG